MKLIIIYGPPASGKFTIAKEIAAQSNYKILHNHSLIDMLVPVFGKEVFDETNKNAGSFWKLINDIRISIIKEAIKQNRNLIITKAHVKKKDPYLSKIIPLVKRNKGEACVIRLACHHEVLKKRVVTKSRREHGKLTSVKELEEWISKYGNESGRAADEFVIDTSNLSPKESAKKILALANALKK